MNLIVGSGPAGIAAAKALLGAGQPVTMLDAGLDLEPDRQQVVARLGQLERAAWNPADLSTVRGEFAADTGGVQLKLLYGSDYPYRAATEGIAADIPEGTLKPSFARGGFSTVWGASVLPYNDRDLSGWPITAADLAPHYRAVGSWMPITAADDDLARLYPVYTDDPHPVHPSRQACHLLDRMRSASSRLAKAGVTFGYSRVAMAARECRTCGMCLHGCPYRLIYNSADTLQEILKHPHFLYVSGVRVDRISESGAGVIVIGTDLKTGSTRSWEGNRTFLATGVLPTARIVLESAGLYDQEVFALDSQYTLLPLVSFKSFAGITEDPLHTLCQLYLEIDDPSISEYNLHCQLYTYSDLFEKAFRGSVCGLLARLPFSRRQILSRLLVAMCYAHSKDSGTLGVTLAPPARGIRGTLRVRPKVNPTTHSTFKRLGRKFFGLSRSLGVVPLLPMMTVTTPGRGYHVGGTFPMSANPAGATTDTLGRPFGWQRTHLVDASVFPTVPAATITYTIMANAHRIAVASCSL